MASVRPESVGGDPEAPAAEAAQKDDVEMPPASPKEAWNAVSADADRPEGNVRSEELISIWTRIVAWMRKHILSDDTQDASAMVFHGVMDSPEVFSRFDPDDARGEFLSEQRLAAIQNGRAKFGWTLCNPLQDRRLWASLCLLAGHIALVLITIFLVTLAACLWTSKLAAPASPGLIEEPAECGSIRTSTQLKALLLSIDVPLFFCVGMGYTLASVNLLDSSRFVRTACVGVCQLVLVFVGSLIVAEGDSHQIWGEKGSMGFAGMWVLIQNLLGVSGVCAVATWGWLPEDRVVPSRMSSLRLGIVLLCSATLLQGVYYLVDFLATGGVHKVLGLVCFFAAAFVVVSSIKWVMRLWLSVPALSVTFMLFWFQAGSYLSLRLVLQFEEDLRIFTLYTGAAALMEVFARLAIVVDGKALYNYYVSKENQVMALRILDLHIATLVVDILAEWSAIAAAGALSAAVDDEVFQGLAGAQDAASIIGSLVIQISFEFFADAASLAVTCALLPISLEGILKSRAYFVVEVSCLVVSLIFGYTILNLRVRVDCFST